MYFLCLIFLTINLALLNSNPINLELDKNPMYNDGLFEGDIKLNENKGLGQATTLTNKWPQGIVPYVIDKDTGYTAVHLDRIYSGMKLIEDSTRINGKDCIKFVPKTTENNFLRIMNNLGGCWSAVGRESGHANTQALSIDVSGANCAWTGIVAHELIHALGFWHEQSRPDRDNFIKINYENIPFNQQYNFQKITNGIDLYNMPYDLKSIMHYEWNAFSSNGKPTIEALDGTELLPAYKKDSLSDIDIAEIRKAYKCE